MQYVVSFERHSLKENAISALPSLCSCPPASLPNSWVLMLFSFSGSSLVGSHSPQNVIVTCSLGGGVLVGTDPVPQPSSSSPGCSPDPVLHSREFLLLQGSFRVCGLGCTGLCIALHTGCKAGPRQDLTRRSISYKGRIIVLQSGADTGTIAQKNL